MSGRELERVAEMMRKMENGLYIDKRGGISEL